MPFKFIDDWYLKFLRWRRDHIDLRSFTVLVSIAVGILSGGAAVVLKAIISTAADWASYFPAYLFFLTPLVGITIVACIKKYFFETVSRYSGIGNILKSISKHSAFIEPILTYSRMITAGITQGFGGSAGLESTIVVTGSAIGSNVAKFFKLSHKYRTLFIACGSAAGIAAIFNAPIAGVIFALEVIIPSFSTTIFIPILISSATGALFAHLFINDTFIFNVYRVSEFTIHETGLIILLGVACGLSSIYFTSLSISVEKRMKRITSWFWRAVIGGGILGVLIASLPLLYGEGYNSINLLLNDKAGQLWENTVFEPFHEYVWFPMLFFFLLIFIKPMAATFTIESGGDGGHFAPSFISGGYLGYVFYLVVQYLFPEWQIDPINYILLGMAGMLSGVMHAPLMAIFIIAEISGSYSLFIPLMIISAISFFMKSRYQKVPIFLNSSLEVELAESHYEALPLNQIKVRNLVEKEFEKVPLSFTLREMKPLIARSSRNLFPVVTEENELIGVLLVNDIKLVMFEESKEHTKIADLMQAPPAIVNVNEPMTGVMEKFDQTEAWNLPVVDENNQYLGFLSKSRIFSAYRKELTDSRSV